MKLPWRLQWVLQQLWDRRSWPLHRAVLVAPRKFWLALFLKAPPVVAYPFAFELKLKRGGSILINDFMALFIYREIFVDGCYDVALDQAIPTIIDVGANVGMSVSG